MRIGLQVGATPGPERSVVGVVEHAKQLGRPRDVGVTDFQAAIAQVEEGAAERALEFFATQVPVQRTGWHSPGRTQPSQPQAAPWSCRNSSGR